MLVNGLVMLCFMEGLNYSDSDFEYLIKSCFVTMNVAT